MEQQQTAAAAVHDDTICPVCSGTGRGHGDADHCGFCGGNGSVPEAVAIALRERQARHGQRATESRR